MHSILKRFKYKHALKNILIFLPFFFDLENINLAQIKLFLISFIGFIILTNTIYFINDYSDYEIDKLNKLKKKYIVKKNYLLLISFLLGLLLFFYIFYFENFYNYCITLYIVNFILYNYLFKRIFFLDLVFLTNFYIIRILYGFELYDNLEISYYFLTFIFLFFISLAACKRLVQVQVNDLDTSNKIIKYSNKNYFFLKKIANISLFSSAIFYLIFLLNLFTEKKIFGNFIYQDKTFDKISYLLISILFVILFSIFFKVINLKIPSVDIFDFTITNKSVIIMCLIIMSYCFYIAMNT